MPIYTYSCEQCGEKFEACRGIYDSDEGVKCPKCHSPKPRRELTSVYSRVSDPNKGNLRFPT
ncbi:MAG: zinc ribbon domain-containing protein [Dehalococcoidales bacterium]